MDARQIARVQLAHLALEQAGDAVELGGVPPRFRAALALDVAGHHLQVVEPAEQILELFEHAREPTRRDPAELVNQLEHVPELLGRDPHLVEPIEGEQRAGFRHGRIEPVGSARKASPQQRRARLARRTAGGRDQPRKVLQHGDGLSLLDLPHHVLLGLAALGVDG